jgi:hypothetical protein
MRSNPLSKTRILYHLKLTRSLLAAVSILLYALHQDFWLWRAARPLWFALPPALLYHAGYCLAVSLLMFLLVRYAWPKDLESGDRGDR